MSKISTMSGLYFGEEQITDARQQREKNKDIQVAWDWLLAEPGTLVIEKKPHKKARVTIPVYKPTLSELGAALEAGFRFRFAGDESAGMRAAQALQMGGVDWQQAATLQETLMKTAATLQIFALVQPLLGADAAQWRAQQAHWLRELFVQGANVNYVEGCWRTLLHITGGLLLDEESWLQEGAARIRTIIDEDIHPEGFLRPAVERDKPDGNSLLRMLLAVAALSLAAEAASAAEIDLWGYANRDVGLNTAVTYLVYYYFYPDKWRWDDALEVEATQALFKEYGAFIEMAATHDYPRGVELLLEAERPFFSVYTGGLTTLSHSRTRPKHRLHWLL